MRSPPREEYSRERNQCRLISRVMHWLFVFKWLRKCDSNAVEHDTTVSISLWKINISHCILHVAHTKQKYARITSLQHTDLFALCNRVPYLGFIRAPPGIIYKSWLRHFRCKDFVASQLQKRTSHDRSSYYHQVPLVALFLCFVASLFSPPSLTHEHGGVMPSTEPSSCS